jgi:hypothetical protein
MFLLFFFLLLLSQPVYATQNADIKVSAAVGENEVTIFGQSSPNSRIELTGINIYSLAFSQPDGSFKFDKIILPKNSSELCLTSKDTNNRTTTPTCIPPPPATNYHTDIGPILLPPTISLEQDKINPNSTVISSGQSIPNSPVTIFFYKVTDNAKSFPKSVLAYSLPALKTTSDNEGYYSLNLPTAYSSNYRFYTSVQYNDNFSPKSNTLLYLMPSFSSLWIQRHSSLTIFLFIFTLTILLFFILLFLNSKTCEKIIKTRFLPAIRTSYLALNTPNIYPENLHRSFNIPK